MTVTLEDIRRAARVIAGRLHRTPVAGSGYLSRRTGLRLLFKQELFQKTGSFKPRGVLNKLSRLSHDERRRGVITFSAGNHAQALAYAASLWGVPSVVVMPATSVRSKVEASRSYGAEVVLTKGDLLETCMALQRERGMTLVHPFDDPEVIAGQGTVGLEVLEDVPEVDAVVMGIGGGGLISGVAVALKEQRPQVRVIGVEPEGACAMAQSLEAGRPVRLERVDTVADGLAAPFAGELTFGLVRRYVDDVVVVGDDEILQAMALIMERCKVVAEPAAAAPLAALLSGKVAVPPHSTVVCVLSGGNVDPARLARLLA